MKQENNQQDNDLRNKRPEELIDYYSSISEDILTLNRLLDVYKDSEEAVKKYQKIKQEEK